MSITSPSAGRPDRPIGPPGVYVIDRAPAATAAPTLMSGVPAFLGFAEPDTNILERRGVPAAVLTRWNAHSFARSIRPAGDSFLAMAVQGFFANGGQRCVVLAVPPEAGVSGLLEVLQAGGPLEDRSDIDLVCIPDAVSPLMPPDAAPYEVHAAALEHCERMGDRFAILDMRHSRPENGPDRAAELLNMAGRLRSPFGALYYPWIAVSRLRSPAGRVPSPGNQEWRCRLPSGSDAEHGPIILGPPSGHIAGSYARLDTLIGPRRAPANIGLEGVVDVAVHLSEGEQALLNRGSINCLCAEHGDGVRAVGARTLSDRSGLAFVSSARVYLGFRRWLAFGMRDLVFEPNSDDLRERIRRRLESQCLALLQSGALAGSDASEAFFVKCDDETNTTDDAALGRIVAHVGLAPSVPAEFIVLRVEHEPTGVNVSSLS